MLMLNIIYLSNLIENFIVGSYHGFFHKLLDLTAVKTNINNALVLIVIAMM